MAKRGLARFTDDHPRCCFCGGIRETVSRDHQPARVFFRGKRMPDETAYPACEQCQNASREAEAAVSLFVTPRGPMDADREAHLRRLGWLHRKNPGLVQGLLLTPAQKIDLVREMGLVVPGGVDPADMPLVKLNERTWSPYLQMIADKLLLALHYRWFGVPLSPEGKMIARFTLNAHLGEDEGYRAMAEAVEHAHLPRHGNENLGDQMLVKWHADPEHRAGMFLVHLHDILYVYGITCDDPEWWRRICEGLEDDDANPSYAPGGA